MNIEKEIESLEKIQKTLTPITTDDLVVNAYKLSAFALIVNALKHLSHLLESQYENNKRI
tara:strand:- start:96 stop:275 length:180 start_codon:yes stop_codon:yes gene_type:complete